MRQKTIRRDCSLWGVSLHHNRTVKLTFLPAGEGTGIYFQFASQKLPVLPGSLLTASTKFTALTNGIVRVECVEHVLAAVTGLGLTNLGIVLEYDNEPPWLDGSAWPFVRQLLSAGLVGQDAPVPQAVSPDMTFIQPSGTDSYVKIFKQDWLTVDCTIDFPNIIGRQRYIFQPRPDSFIIDICRARSFIPYPINGNERETAKRLPGFVLRGPDSNVIVYNDYNYLTPLRFDNEPVRHKILDFVGDIAVLGRPLVGYVVLYKPSHLLNGLLVKKLCENVEQNATSLPVTVSGSLSRRLEIH